MTEPTDPTGPGVPEPRSTSQDGDRAWFRGHLDPIVDAPDGNRAADGWPALAGAAAGAPPHAPAVPAPRRRPSWVLAVAALVLAVAAIATVVAVNRHDDAVPLSTVDDPPTGWYVPVGLPDGWKVERVDGWSGAPSCGGWEATWRRDQQKLTGDERLDPSVLIQVDFTGCGQAPTQADVHEDPTCRGMCEALISTPLDDGIVATEVGTVPHYDDLTTARTLSWNRDGLWKVWTTGLTGPEATAVANAIIADPRRDDLPVADLEPVERQTFRKEPAHPTVDVTVRAPSGKRATYGLALPSGTSFRAPGWQATPVQIAGQPEDVVRIDPPASGPGSTAWGSTRFAGHWDGADVTFERRVVDGEQTADAIGDAELEALVGAMRPATTSAWHAFLADVPSVSDRLGEAGTLAGLGTLGIRPDESGAEGPHDPPVSEDGTVVRHDEQAAGTDLDGLKVRLELTSDQIEAGRPAQGTLLVRNTTDQPIDVAQCTLDQVNWGLIPADDPEADLESRPRRCSATGTIVVRPGKTARYPMHHYSGTGYAAQRQDPGDVSGHWLGTLDGGRYLAVAELAGTTSTIRVQLPVTVEPPACATSDEDVRAYRGLTEEAARAKAAADGDSIRIVTVDGSGEWVSSDVDCSRIDLDLTRRRIVTNAVRY